jgi:hemerythrin superfamily protein
MHDGQPIDPATHIACVRLAWKLVHRIQAVLRPDEIDECARQFYRDIRDHVEQEKLPARGGR